MFKKIQKKYKPKISIPDDMELIDINLYDDENTFLKEWMLPLIDAEAENDADMNINGITYFDNNYDYLHVAKNSLGEFINDRSNFFKVGMYNLYNKYYPKQNDIKYELVISSDVLQFSGNMVGISNYLVNMTEKRKKNPPDEITKLPERMRYEPKDKEDAGKVQGFNLEKFEINNENINKLTDKFIELLKKKNFMSINFGVKTMSSIYNPILEEKDISLIYDWLKGGTEIQKGGGEDDELPDKVDITVEVNKVSGVSVRASRKNPYLHLYYTYPADSDLPKELKKPQTIKLKQDGSNWKSGVENVKWTVDGKDEVKKLYEFIGLTDLDLKISFDLRNSTQPNEINLKDNTTLAEGDDEKKTQDLLNKCWSLVGEEVSSKHEVQLTYIRKRPAAAVEVVIKCKATKNTAEEQETEEAAATQVAAAGSEVAAAAKAGEGTVGSKVAAATQRNSSSRISSRCSTRNRRSSSRCISKRTSSSSKSSSNNRCNTSCRRIRTSSKSSRRRNSRIRSSSKTKNKNSSKTKNKNSSTRRNKNSRRRNSRIRSSSKTKNKNSSKTRNENNNTRRKKSSNTRRNNSSRCKGTRRRKNSRCKGTRKSKNNNTRRKKQQQQEKEKQQMQRHQKKKQKHQQMQIMQTKLNLEWWKLILQT